MFKSGTSKVFLSLVLILVLSFALGIRVAHPKDGLGSAMGPAKSSLVVYKKGNSVVAGDRVISKVNGDLSPIFAVVSSTGGENVALQFETGFVSTTKDQIEGKMIIVIPFLGALAGIFGL